MVNAVFLGLLGVVIATGLVSAKPAESSSDSFDFLMPDVQPHIVSIL